MFQKKFFHHGSIIRISGGTTLPFISGNVL